MNSRKGIPALVLGAAAVVGLTAGCNGSTGGSPQPGGSASSAPSSSDDGSGGGVPKVQHPLDASVFVKNQCSALTASDLSALGLNGAQTKTDSDSLGSGCSWTLGEKVVNVEWETVDRHGLSDLYKLKSNYAYWNATTVNGYPAVEGASADDRSTGGCTVNVGVNDQLFFFVQSELDNGAQACPTAKQAASAVITNLKAAQGGG